MLSNDFCARSKTARSGAENPIFGKPSFGMPSKSIMSREGCLKGSGRSSTAFTTLKMAVFAPMPRASVRTATSVKPGLLASIRNAYRKSCRKFDITYLPALRRGLCSGGLRRAGSRSGRRRLADHPAILQLDNAASIRRVSLGVRDLNNRRACVVQSLEQFHDFFALRGMQVSGRLIGKDELRVENHGAGHADELLLPAGELVREEIFLADNVKTVQRVADQADAFLMRHILVRERDFQVLEHRQIVDQVIALKHEADVRFVQLVALLDVELVDGFSVEKVISRPRTIQHSKNAQQRGLARAGRPHDGHKFARLNIEIDSAQQVKFIRSGLDYFLQISQRYQRFHIGSLRFER